MPSLIDSLNKHSHLPPDEIVKRLADPFTYWRRGNKMTREEYRANPDLVVVLLNECYAHDPRRHAEQEHRVGRWNFNSHWQDWLGGDYLIRSQESFDANRDEQPDLDSELCRR